MSEIEFLKLQIENMKLKEEITKLKSRKTLNDLNQHQLFYIVEKYICPTISGKLGTEKYIDRIRESKLSDQEIQREIDRCFL